MRPPGRLYLIATGPKGASSLRRGVMKVCRQKAGASNDRAGDMVAGYRIAERIGRGGMGDVYRAWDERLHRQVAIKVPRVTATFDEVAKRRFLRETRVACRVNHP